MGREAVAVGRDDEVVPGGLVFGSWRRVFPRRAGDRRAPAGFCEGDLVEGDSQVDVPGCWRRAPAKVPLSLRYPCPPMTILVESTVLTPESLYPLPLL